MSFKIPELRTKSTQESDPPGVTPLWLVRSVNWIAWLFVAILVMTVFLRSLDIARDKAVPLEVTHAGTWIGQLAFFFPLFAPLVLAAVALPWTAKVIIPAFCSFDWRNPRHRAPKIWCAIITGAVAIVTMTSGFPLYHGAYNERFKQEAVKLEQVDMGRKGLEADLKSVESDLASLAASPNKYQAQASIVGAKAWAKRIATAEADKDPQLGMIKKALGDAERGDELRQERKKANRAVATAPTKAAAMEQIKGDKSYGSDAVVDFINAWWGFALFIVIEMCALVAGWIAYMMMMMRTQQIADYEAVHSEPVSEAGIDMRITDQTQIPQPIPGEVQMFEEPLGSGIMVEKIFVRTGYKEDGVTPHGYWRQLPKKKSRGQEDLDAAAAERDAGRRNPTDWFARSGNDPRAPAANEVELQGEDEVGDVAEEQGYQAQIELEALHDPDIRSGFGEAALEQPDAYGNAGDAGSSLGAGSRIDSIEAEGDLTHAQEDQQDYEPEAAALGNDGEGEVGFEDVREAAEMASSDGDQGRDEPLGGSGPLLDDADSEPQDSLESLTQTLLPNNEGVLVGTPIIPDDEADALNEEFAARRAAAEAAE